MINLIIRPPLESNLYLIINNFFSILDDSVKKEKHTEKKTQSECLETSVDESSEKKKKKKKKKSKVHKWLLHYSKYFLVKLKPAKVSRVVQFQ